MTKIRISVQLGALAVLLASGCLSNRDDSTDQLRRSSDAAAFGIEWYEPTNSGFNFLSQDLASLGWVSFTDGQSTWVIALPGAPVAEFDVRGDLLVVIADDTTDGDGQIDWGRSFQAFEASEADLFAVESTPGQSTSYIRITRRRVTIIDGDTGQSQCCASVTCDTSTNTCTKSGCTSGACS